MLMEIFPEYSEEANSQAMFMQDGAPAHTSRMAMEGLENRFPESLISNKSDFIWPPRSPDINPLDFFLWGYMKEEIHRAQPGSIAEVKQLIQNFMTSISEDLLQRVTRQFVSRIRRCIEVHGGVIECFFLNKHNKTSGFALSVDACFIILRQKLKKVISI